ncbi:TonB-dependent siderophore receptor [Acinetobacter pittii]|nr:TonB-dependent siderophore receptor [Acinetobacter pittii]MBN6526489.1 TonB-dependent siderophore receptor [Acinetobacter pittii]MBN6536133.1 TonB-dependent siderophore receptor [Acinetobacter pittii]MEB6670802.1 TonB-dependent siderophore receptor [Acinetobacter pittii]
MALIAPSIVYADETNGTATLETIKVQAEENSAVTEGSGSYTAKSTNTSTKLNLSLRETPQSVKVLTREYLDDRKIDSFQDLMNNITGVSTSRTDERQKVYARGFEVDYYLIDGIPSTINLGTGDLDLDIYDRVEVVKGANGLTTGAGNPAMALNMIRKHANSKELSGNVSTSLGSWNSWSSSADISTSLNADGSLRGRMFVKHSDENSFMDFYEKERNVFYGALDYDLSDKTSMSLGATYQELHRDGIRWGGTPAFYTDGTRTNFSRSLTVSAPWTYWDVNTTAVFANLKQNLFSDVNLNVAYTFRKEDTDSMLLYTAGRVDKATNTSPLKNKVEKIDYASVYGAKAASEENNIDVFINAPFMLFNRPQEIIIGGSWNKNEKTKDLSGGSNANKEIEKYLGGPLNYNDIAQELLQPLVLNTRGALNETTQTAAYVAGKFQILDPLKIIAGARLSNWKYKSENDKGNREFNNELAPYIGAIYDFAQDHSVYASYTEIFKPQDRKDVNDQYIDPIKGKSYEAGLKSEWFGGRLNTALSVFRIEQSNFAELIPGVFIVRNGTQTTEQAYRAVDGVESKGFEFEADGEINDNWAVNFGIANFEAKDAKGTKVNTTNSRTTSNLFVKYKVNQWSAGLGLNYKSKYYTGSGSSRIEQDAYVLASAMLGYQVDKNIKLQFNIDNIFDEKYYEGIGENSMNWGTPRNATLSVRYNF